MGLSRRQFTREFKLAAVRRLEEGISIAEMARGLEVNPNVLQRWRREFREGPGNAFPGKGQRRWSEGRIAELERKTGPASTASTRRPRPLATGTWTCATRFSGWRWSGRATGARASLPSYADGDGR